MDCEMFFPKKELPFAQPCPEEGYPMMMSDIMAASCYQGQDVLEKLPEFLIE
jgi:hypothetical protein